MFYIKIVNWFFKFTINIYNYKSIYVYILNTKPLSSIYTFNKNLF